MIKAVVFDLGGVLFDIVMDRCVANFKALGWDDVDESLDPCHQRGVIKEMEAGDISAEEFCDRVRQKCRPGTSSAAIRRSLISILGDMHPDKVAFISELSASHDLFILSNNNPIVMDYLEPLLASMGIPVGVTFKDAFYSYRMKMLKPDPAFFREAFSRTGHRPEEILFVDDSPANVEAAAQQGVRAVLYEQGTSLRSLVMANL